MQDSSSGVKLEKQSTEKDPERFYCPFPGCNRSFAELWRLKVHYRAPPDIRGSGKERGHGTELTQCPKCGKSLKPGKHHVGCSAGRSAPRQTTKRTRLAVPDPSILDLALLKDDQLAMGDGLMPESFMQQLVGGGFPQHMFGMPDSQQQQHMPTPDMLQQQQQHMLQMGLSQQQHDFNNMLQAQMGFVQQQMPLYQQVPQQQQQPPTQQLQQQQQQQTTPQLQQNPHNPQQCGDASTDLSAMFASFPNATLAPVQHQAAPATSGPTLNFTPDDSLNFFNLFDYGEPGTAPADGQPPTPPSPPPLPADFDNRPANPLFQFSQFNQKLPSNLTPASMPGDPTLNLSSTPTDGTDAWAGAMGYEKSNDGDLMHILFGLPDEYPTMATVHLHHFEQPASCAAAPGKDAQGHEQQHGRGTAGGDFDSPRFARLLHGDLESSLDLFPDPMEAEDDCVTGPNSGTSSVTAMEPASTSGKGGLKAGEESQAESQAASSSRKDAAGEDSMEPMLSPTALVKGDKPVLTRTSTFERELYHLLRPCE